MLDNRGSSRVRHTRARHRPTHSALASAFLWFNDVTYEHFPFSEFYRAFVRPSPLRLRTEVMLQYANKDTGGKLAKAWEKSMESKPSTHQANELAGKQPDKQAS